MKIVVLGTRGFPGVQGGVERHCEKLYPRLVGLGCDITVIARAPYIEKSKRVKDWMGVKFVYLWCVKKQSLEALTHTFLGVLKARILSPDILHIHSIGPSLMVPLARLLGLMVVVTDHGPDYERAKWGKAAKALLKAGERSAAMFSNRVIAISMGITFLLFRKYGTKAAYIPNGVEVPLPEPPGEELDRWGLRSGCYVFTACRFVPEKGLHDLIEGYRRLSEPPFRLVIAGDADHKSEYSRGLKALARETKGVVLTGMVSGKRIGELFSNAGLFVLPSYYEGLPIALLEAMSYGIPVVVSDIPQHREISLDGSRYFETGNIEGLARAMREGFKKGMDEPEKQRYLDLIKTEYNWGNIAMKTMEVYMEILS